jgi:hypothetical protein
MVRARLAEVNGDIVEAEHILIEQGKVDEAIEMYQLLQRWDDAIGVAESQGHTNAAQMRDQYMQVRVVSCVVSSRVGWGNVVLPYGDKTPFVVVVCCASVLESCAVSSDAVVTVVVVRPVVQYLLESGQEAKAGSLKEKEGDYRTAITLYLKVCAHPGTLCSLLTHVVLLLRS